MLIKTKDIDCASKSVFNTWKLPTSAADTSGDIYWSAIVYIQDTGEVWTHGKLYGGFFSNADSNKVSLTIGGTTKILALDGHVQSYTTLTGSGTTADQAILSTGVANKWTLKTLGKNAFSNVDYLPADATAVAAEKVVNAMRFQYNGKDMHSFDGSVARLLNIIQGDNVFITGDSQGNVTIAADPGSDTVNTAGATNLINKKLFLIGAESQTTSPQTYSNQYVYIGTDNCLYSLGKKVLTEHQAIYNLDLQTQVGDAVTKVTTFDPNAANNSFTLVQGTNVTLIPDATNKKVTISSKDTTYDFYNLAFKQGDAVIDTYKPTTAPNKAFRAGTNVTFTKSGDEITVTTQDTRNTAGATEKLATKLFLTGSLTQTDNPQTYTNSKVYIGTDNKLYSDGKVVSTGDHTHNYAGATSPGGPALKVDLNPSGLLAATYGSYGGILQDSNNGPVAGSWSNRIKILHNNTSGYYTELAQAFTGTAGLWHRRNVAGVVSDWTPVIDKANFRTYLDATYVIRGNDPSVLTNYVRYNQASGLTMNWEWGNATPTHIWGAKNSDSSKAYVFNGDNIRAFANAVNRAGDTMTGTLKVTEIQTTGGNGLAMYSGTDWTYLGQQAGTTYIRSGATDIYHRKNGTDYKIWDANNDGSGSGLDADLLDGVQLIQKGGNNGVLRSWARGSYTTVNQYFGNGVVVVIDPKPTDSNELWANTAIFSIGDTAVRNWQVAYGYGTDTIKARRISDGPTYNAWKTFAFLDSNVASATRADYPTGFTSKLSSATWGNQDGTFVTGWGGPSSADIQFRNNGGKLNVIIDGTFYQDEGRYKVLDTNNYSSTLDARYLLKGSGVTAGNNSSWLSFSNDAGGIGGTMGTNDQWRIYGRSTASNAGYLEIATADDAAEPIYVRQYSGVFATLSRTLTLLDASGNTTMPGTATAGNFSTAGRYITSYSSGTWINSVTNAALTVNMGSSYGGIWCAPVKGGRVVMSVYPASNNNVYLGYASTAQITAGTNPFTRQTYWNADDGIWRAGGYAKDGSSASYVLLGDGGHTSLGSLGASHNHFERTSIDPNNVINGPRTYESTSTANRPDSNLWHQYTTLGTGDNAYCHQLSYAYAGGTNIYHRIRNAGSWGGWITILDSSNYGSICDGRYVNVSGDTMTGALNFANGTWNKVGDDAYIGDMNYAGQVCIGAVNTSNPGIGFFNSSNTYVGSLVANGSTLQWRGTNVSLAGHSHNMNDIADAANVYLNAGTVTRKIILTKGKNNQGYISRVALGLTNPANQFSPAILSVGTNDGGTSWTDFYFNTNGRISSSAGTFALTTDTVANADTVDGLHASSFMRAVSANGYYGMARPDGNTSDWIRTTSSGIIPYQSGGSGSGHCNLGTSSWYFSQAYIQNIYGTLNGTATNANKLNITGYQSDGLSFHQTSSSFDGSTADWAHYIIANHGNGSSYYHYTIRLPFYGVAQYRRQTGSTSSVTQWYKFWTEENLDPVDKTLLHKSRVPGEMVDFYVYKVGSYTCTSTDYTTFKNQLFDSSGRGKSSVTYQPTSASSKTYTVNLSDFILAYNGISAYSNGMYTAGGGELESNRIGSTAGANSKTISGLEMPKHAHWFGRYKSDNANDRDVFGPDGGQNHSTNGTTSAGQGGNWRTGYSGSGSAKDWRPKTIFVFKMIYAPQSW